MQRIYVELLISAVQSRPVLWQDSHKDFKNKKITEKEWNEVGEVCNCSGIAAKAKWKNLKDTFRRTLQKLPRVVSGSETQSINVKWPYFELMSFIKQIIVPHPIDENLWEAEEYSTQNTDYIDVFEDIYNEEEGTLSEANMPSTSTGCSCSYNLPNTNRKRATSINLDAELLHIEKKRLKILKQEVERKEENTDDMQFFKSLLPFMRKFDDLEKLEIRGEIQNVILAKLKRKKNENVP